MKHLFPNATDSFKALNPHIFGVGGLGAQKSKSNQGRKVGNHELEGGAGSMGFRITLIAIRRRLLDGHDNARAACKPLVDRITAWLGFGNDDDPNLHWQYGQVQTTGKEGTLVTIEQL